MIYHSYQILWKGDTEMAAKKRTTKRKATKKTTRRKKR